MLCRPDWETVLSAVIDAVLMRPDVDPSRVAAIGIGHGGYLLARALCFEHRLAAAVVDPGIVDLAARLDRADYSRCWRGSSLTTTGWRSIARSSWPSSSPRNRQRRCA